MGAWPPSACRVWRGRMPSAPGAPPVRWVRMGRGLGGLAPTPSPVTPNPLSVRVAVNTGEVVVSAGDADVVGDPVNVAARLQEVAGDGDVLIGESTRRLVSELVTLAPLGTLTL